jgi:hypothetical protein
MVRYFEETQQDRTPDGWAGPRSLRRDRSGKTMSKNNDNDEDPKKRDLDARVAVALGWRWAQHTAELNGAAELLSPEDAAFDLRFDADLHAVDEPAEGVQRLSYAPRYTSSPEDAASLLEMMSARWTITEGQGDGPLMFCQVKGKQAGINEWRVDHEELFVVRALAFLTAVQGSNEA